MAEAKKRDVYLYGTFNESNIKSVVESLLEINSEDESRMRYDKNPTIKPIRLHISSYGGHVAHLQALLTVMDSIIAPVVTIVEGAAYSCGSLLSVAGDYRMIGSSARIMIHPPTAGSYGELSYLKDASDSLEQINQWSINHYLRHSNIEKAQLEEAFKTHKQWYITPRQALELGLVDEIIPKKDYELDTENKTLKRTIDGVKLSIKLT